ncbi:VWA domain-containing protein (plasmid) [Aneurinibacillus sp. Ricciae_BoGa-3]|uniref:vWA domain-containing protein n=1 Tax=Aneurinibacillus sp. Ricciae_BoGa-3 TaxID=3022697 RepID=UPI0023402FDB|nr:VWA domain-containing protein [Aneurinibacillus sp. Ricciae_BoGa-3]WCK57063.1 VWA domain-containing protein [Aneurinibacillus sp. Ricciae_BoGa-3]
MGLFDRFMKGNQPQQEGAGGINISKEQAIQTLNLRKEAFSICLEKKSLDLIARVGVAMDDSGSMEKLFKNGTVQTTVERFLPVALRLDDNRELDIWLFSEGYKRLPSITERDFYDYVNREVMSKASWGGTNYAPIIRDIVKKYAVEEPSPVPTFIIFVTDGENWDKEEAKRAITEASKHNIFFQFVGIGRESFQFLQKLDDLEGRYIDNADFFKIEDINSLSDERLYDMLMTEYPSWEKEARRVGLVR